VLKKQIGPALGITFFVLPLFPSFITLTGASVPGISLLPKSVTLLLLGVVFLAVVYGIATLCSEAWHPGPLFGPLLWWLGAAIVSALLGFDPAAGALFIAIFAFGVVWHAGVMRFYNEPGVARIIFGSFLLSGALAAGAAIAMVLAKWPVAQYTFQHGRATGTFILPGELAGYLIIYLPVAFAVLRTAPTKLLRGLASAGLLLGSIAFLMTVSRAGWIGMAVGVAFLAVVIRQRARLRTAASILIVAGAAVLLFFNARHNPSENYTRISIWQAAVEMIERFPLTGVGPFDFARVYALVRLPGGEASAFHAHSFLLTVAAETGLLGLVAVLYTWWRFIVLLHQRLLAAGTPARSLALAVAAGLLGTWVQGLIDTVSVVIFGLWLPFLAVALSSAQYGWGEA